MINTIAYNLIAPYIKTIENTLFEKDGLAMCYMGAWLGYIILTRQKYEEEWVDLGYDLSSHPKKTNNQFNLNQYETVDDFLSEECNGETEATFSSGHGFRCGTFSDDFYSIALEAYNLFIEKNIPELHKIYIETTDFDNEIQWYDDIYDIFDELGIDNYALENHFKEQPMMETYEYYLPYAKDKIQKEIEENKNKQLIEEKRISFLKDIAQTLPEELQLFKKNIQFGFNKSNWQILLDFLAHHEKNKVGATLQLVNLWLSHSVRKDLFELYPEPKNEI